MNETAWNSFLKEYNNELLSYEEVVEGLSPALIKEGWLGYTGATEKEIVRIEKRLAIKLPPSYRNFLKASNGWRFPSTFIFDLLPVEKIAWFKEQNQDWIDAYVGPSIDLPPVSDEEYFLYGEKQDCCKFRTEYLHTALQISEPGDSAVVLLNPKVVTPDGEWETWFFANWLPGATRYRSFGEWLATERTNCRKLLKKLPKTEVKKYATAKKPVSAMKAAEVARRGEIVLALESLESFAAKGDFYAVASLAELYAFFGQWDKVMPNAGRIIANPIAVGPGNVFYDMVKLLGRAGHRSGEWNRVIEAAEAALKANAKCSNKAAAKSWDKIFRNLIDYADREGKPPHELVALFKLPYPDSMENMSEKELKAWYQNAIKIADANPHLKKDPDGKIEYCFNLAKGYLEDEAMRLYETHGKKFRMAWQAAEYVAPIYVRRGNPDLAWAVIQANFQKWWPVGYSQVAPVVLLTDEYLNTLMTPERCQLILSTPRGPEALKEKR